VGVEGEGWRWRRRLFAWEEELVVDCCSLLENIVLQESIVNTWSWKLDPTQGYSVKGVYNMSMHDDQQV